MLDDEIDEFARTSAQRVLDETALVPPIFAAEVSNALVVAARKNRLTREDVRERISRIGSLPIFSDKSWLVLDREVELALKHGLTVYDAAYLALAARSHLTLLTRDAALQRAATAENVATI